MGQSKTRQSKTPQNPLAQVEVDDLCELAGNAVINHLAKLLACGGNFCSAQQHKRLTSDQAFIFAADAFLCMC